MRIGVAQLLTAFVVIASACATAHSTGGPDAPVQLQVPEALAWDTDGAYDIPIVLANSTRMILMAVEPKVEASDVTILRADGSVACKTPRAVEKTYPKWTPGSLGPGTHWKAKRDMKQFCAVLAPGVYTYEVNYIFNNADESLTTLYKAHLGPQGGKILVKQDATAMKYEDLLAALEHPEAFNVPAAEPDAAAPTTAGDAAPPAGQAAVAVASTAAPSAAEIRACVDRELHDRGLNAYGDPKDTTYPGGNAPVDEFGRILYVASRNPGIRKSCNIPMF